jgi:hypothetical protein
MVGWYLERDYQSVFYWYGFDCEFKMSDSVEFTDATFELFKTFGKVVGLAVYWEHALGATIPAFNRMLLEDTPVLPKHLACMVKGFNEVIALKHLKIFTVCVTF